MKNLMNKMVVVGLLIGTAAFGSGFKCEGDLGYSVKLFNKTGATRVPAVLIVSQQGLGTLLKATGTDIRKYNRSNTVQYVVDGNEQLNADQVILQISFKEGRETLTANEVASGQLILVKDGEREVISLSCERYLKND